MLFGGPAIDFAPLEPTSCKCACVIAPRWADAHDGVIAMEKARFEGVARPQPP
jgi:hypothetical protein